MKPQRAKIKSGILTIMLLLLLPLAGMASPCNMKAIFSYGMFLAPPTSPYIETYIAIDASSLNLKPVSSGKLQGEVELTIIFEQNEKVVNFEKVILKSPEFDSAPTAESFFMGQHRFALPNGSYDVLIRLRDTQTDSAYFDHREVVVVDFKENSPVISDILLIDEFKKVDVETENSRFGYEFVPHILPFLPQGNNQLTFYVECYNLDQHLGKDSRFVMQYFIEDFESGILRPEFSGISRESASNINMAMKRFDISQLPSGNYNLVVCVKDASNQKILENRLFFQRSNPGVEPTYTNVQDLDVTNTFASRMNNVDSLADYIMALFPISSDLEKSYSKNQLEAKDLKQMQKYFYHFWSYRNSSNPEAAWLEYKERVDYVNRVYSISTIRGYQTDRGRVVLQYGRPNAIAKRDFETCYVPFEIWEYQQLTPTQRNKRFVFCKGNFGDPDFDLIHSDANGEKYNGNWPYILNKNHSKTSSVGSRYDFEQWNTGSGSGDNSSECNGVDLKDLYKNPR